MQAGNFTTRFRWYRHTQTEGVYSDDTLFLWGRIAVESGRRQEDYDSIQTGSEAEIYLRNYPFVSAEDKLTNPQWGTWIVDTVRRGENEIIVEAHKFDALEGI